MNNPLISILTTLYNREKYIADCIESVLSSSFQDWEMIIVDDQSSDRSVEIAQQFASQDARIKVYVNEKNLGDYPNRNQAASYAKGKYLKYIDADDTIYPHGLEIMVSAMERNPEAVLGSQCVIREYKVPYPFLLQKETLFKEYFFGHNFFSSGPTGTIIRKDIFEKVGGYSGTRFVGDTELWTKMAFEGPVVFFQPALIWWRTHEDQETNHEKKHEKELLSNKHQLFKDILSNPLLPLKENQRGQIIKKYKQTSFKEGLSALLKYRNMVKCVFKFKVATEKYK